MPVKILPAEGMRFFGGTSSLPAGPKLTPLKASPPTCSSSCLHSPQAACLFWPGQLCIPTALWQHGNSHTSINSAFYGPVHTRPHAQRPHTHTCPHLSTPTMQIADDTLDVFAAHGMGVTSGSILTALFQSTIHGAPVDGAFYGSQRSWARHLWSSSAWRSGMCICVCVSCASVCACICECTPCVDLGKVFVVVVACLAL